MDNGNKSRLIFSCVFAVDVFWHSNVSRNLLVFNSILIFQGGKDGLFLCTRKEPSLCSGASQYPGTCHSGHEQKQWGLPLSSNPSIDKNSAWGCQEDFQDHYWNPISDPYHWYCDITVVTAFFFIKSYMGFCFIDLNYIES